MKKLFNISCFLGMAILIGCGPNKNSRPDTPKTPSERIDSLFRSQFDQDRFHGGVMITHLGQTVYENYLGMAHRSWGIPFDKDVKMDIASVNKSMIAALALKAVEEGLLELDDHLVDLLSGFSYIGHFHPDITLHHLLCHGAGLADYNAVQDDLKQANYTRFKRLRMTDEAYVSFISELRPIGKPGEQFYYSNFGYHLIAIILAKIYHKSFAQLLNDNLTEPLGLSQTLSEGVNETIIPKLAQAYTFQDSIGQWLQNPFIDLSLSRRVFSTASDLNKWAHVMDTPGWLTEKSLMRIKQNHHARLGQGNSYGYGWFVFDGNNKGAMGDLGIKVPYIIHGGSTDGYRSMLVNVNNGEYVISFLSNVGNRTDQMQLTRAIVKILIE